MKDRNDKRKFKESKIGKIIYGFLLFMPLFAIGVTCGYAMFNKNAYQSFATNENNLVQVQYTDLKYGKNYDIEINSASSWTNAITYVVENFSYVTYAGNYVEANDYKRIRFYSNTQLVCKDIDNNNLYLNVGGLSKLSFTYYSYNEDTGFIPNFDIYEEQVKNSNDIQNVFYYSVDKVTQSNLFNWVTTSNIYTGMSNFTTAMSVTNTFIPMLLTYWLIISVIYFLYDMVLILLTVLHRKIHNLQDSI